MDGAWDIGAYEYVGIPPTNNQTPVASAQSVTLTEDGQQVITLAGTDADGNALTYSIVTQPIHGALVAQSGDTTGTKYIYTPEANYNGTDSLTFKVNDGKADSTVATVSINVAAVNDRPIMQLAPVVTGVVGNEVNFSLKADDLDGDKLVYQVVGTLPQGAVFNTSTGQLIWTPAVDQAGNYVIRFMLS